jgi:hypothetical protein
MGSAFVPSQRIEEIYVGNTTIPNPYIMLVVNGVEYANGYRVTYAGGYRTFYGTFDAATGNIFVACQTIAYGEDIPAFSLPNVEVLVIE